MTQPRRCNLCDQKEGEEHLSACAHLSCAYQLHDRDPLWRVSHAVRFGPNERIAAKVHTTCGTFVEEGGLCGCPETPIADAFKAATIDKGILKIPYYDSDHGAMERTQSPATSALACHACKGPRPAFGRRCRACGAYPL